MPRFSVMPNHNPGGSGFMVWDSTDEQPPVWYGFENAATAYADARNAEEDAATTPDMTRRVCAYCRRDFLTDFPDDPTPTCNACAGDPDS